MSETNDVNALVSFLRAMAKTLAENDDIGLNEKRVKMLFDAAASLETHDHFLRGCRDMLREAAKQFRNLGDNGHAVMCDLHADRS